MSIFSKIEEYVARTPLKFHTPGHKGAYQPLDITEIEGVFPAEEIARAERTAAELYGVAHLRFLTGGSSMGVKAAILSAPGDILAEDISHQSVVEGAELADKRLYRLTRRVEDGLAVPPTVDEVLRAAKEYGVQTVLLTSPDYYGRIVEAEVFRAVKAAGFTLLVDGAHGAHFAFSPLLPAPVCRYADLCNMSAHKTLGAYTQSALLAVGNPAFAAAADRALTLLGTTSPSYMLLGGLERALQAAAAAQEEYNALAEAIADLKSAVVCAENADFTRVIVDCAAYDKAGGDTYRALLERGVGAEKSDDRYVVFIVTHYDRPKDIRRLKQILIEVLY